MGYLVVVGIALVVVLVSMVRNVRRGGGSAPRRRRTGSWQGDGGGHSCGTGSSCASSCGSSCGGGGD